MAIAKDIRKLAEHASVYVDSWSPGDGVTRYRFARVPGSYFEWSSYNILGTCLSAREARVFLAGVLAGRSLERESYDLKSTTCPHCGGFRDTT